MKITKTIKYGLMLPSGELARVEASYNGNDRYACGEYTYRLTDDENYPVWLVDKKEDIINTISENIGWYNSQENHPTWGEFELKDFTPVEVTTTTEIKVLEDVKPIFAIDKLLDCRSISALVASRYIGEKLPIDNTYVFCCVNEPKEDMEELVDKIIRLGSNPMKRKLIGVIDVPEEWLEACQTEPKWYEENGYCALIMESIL